MVKNHPFSVCWTGSSLSSFIQSIWSSWKQLPACQATTKEKWLCTDAHIHFADVFSFIGVGRQYFGHWSWYLHLELNSQFGAGLEMGGCPSIDPARVLESLSAHNDCKGIASLWVIQSYNQNVYSVCVLAGLSVVPQTQIHQADCCRATVCINSIYQIINFGSQEKEWP